MLVFPAQNEITLLVCVEITLMSRYAPIIFKDIRKHLLIL